MAAYGVYELTSNLAASTIIQMCKLPAGAVVLGGMIYGPDLDTNATEELDWDFGWEATADEVADPDGFGNFGVIQGDALAEYKVVAGIMLPLQGVLLTAGPKYFSAPATLSFTVNVDAATGGTGTVSVVVYYTMRMTTT